MNVNQWGVVNQWSAPVTAELHEFSGGATVNATASASAEKIAKLSGSSQVLITAYSTLFNDETYIPPYTIQVQGTIKSLTIQGRVK